MPIGTVGGAAPLSAPPGTGTGERRRSARRAPWILALIGVALLAVAAALLWRTFDDDGGTVAAGPDGSAPGTSEPSVSSRPPVSSTTSTRGPSTSPPSSASTVPSTAPATVTTPTAPPPTTAPPPPTAPPPSTAPARVTCPATALEQNRSPGVATIAVEQFTTEGFVVRICWSGSEYLWFGYDRGNPSSSVLLGAEGTASGWQAAHNGYLYQVDPDVLLVTRGSEIIVNDPVVGRETY
jgi:hypothetical protein